LSIRLVFWRWIGQFPSFMALMVLYFWLIEMALSPYVVSTSGFNVGSVFPGPRESGDEIMDFLKVL
jgi:hypothetical protein